jgi:hypothetical protein
MNAGRVMFPVAGYRLPVSGFRMELNSPRCANQQSLAISMKVVRPCSLA